ncbi:Phosphotransferase [Entamoeba marina]
MQSILEQFSVTKEKLEIIIDNILVHLENGLQDKPSTVMMLPSYAPIPTGLETGTFMGIDVGGTNLRVLSLDIPEAGKRGNVKSINCVLPKAASNRFEFFGFVAKKIKEFIVENGMEEIQINAGFTFSFAIDQIAINKGLQRQWAKGWDIKDSIGCDVVEVLQSELNKLNVRNVTITALINDTIGTLANLAYDDSSCGLGLIFGTGTNGCYIEKTANFAKSKLKTECNDEFMVVNVEWGGLNFPELPLNHFDELIDMVSVNKGKQRYEKLIGGIYIGWLTRLCIRDLIEKGVILKQYKDHPAFCGSADDDEKDHSKKFTSRHTGIVDDNTDDLNEVNDVLKSLGVVDSTLDERKIIKTITEAIIRRSAYMAAAATVALYRKMSVFLKERATAGIDGTVYEKNAPFKRFYLEAVDFLQPVDKISCKLSKDGSGIGSIIVAAAVAHKN